MWVIHFGILVCNRQPMHAWFGIFINQEPQLPSLLPDLAHSCICFLWFVLVTYSNWNLTFLLCTSLGKLYNAVQKLWGQATFYLVVSLSPKFLNCIVIDFKLLCFTKKIYCTQKSCFFNFTLFCILNHALIFNWTITQISCFNI